MVVIYDLNSIKVSLLLTTIPKNIRFQLSARNYLITPLYDCKYFVFQNYTQICPFYKYLDFPENVSAIVRLSIYGRDI